MCTANLFPSQTCLQALTLPFPGHPHHTAHAHSVPSSQALRYLSPHTLPPHILPQGVLSRRTKVPPAAPKPPGPALAGLWDSTCGCDIGPLSKGLSTHHTASTRHQHDAGHGRQSPTAPLLGKARLLPLPSTSRSVPGKQSKKGPHVTQEGSLKFLRALLSGNYKYLQCFIQYSSMFAQQMNRSRTPQI